jgi:hypothetical protein
MSTKSKSRQLEVQWPELESFALITQMAMDGDRVVREAAQKEADRLAARNNEAQLQRYLFE